jgi:hypothetical protein
MDDSYLKLEWEGPIMKDGKPTETIKSMCLLLPVPPFWFPSPATNPWLLLRFLFAPSMKHDT